MCLGMKGFSPLYVNSYTMLSSGKPKSQTNSSEMLPLSLENIQSRIKLQLTDF